MVRVNKIRFRTSIELPTRWALMIDDNIMKPQRRKRNSSESKGETNVNETPVWFNSELKHSFISLNSISFFCLFYFNRQLLKDFWKENKTQQKLYFFFYQKKKNKSIGVDWIEENLLEGASEVSLRQVTNLLLIPRATAAVPDITFSFRCVSCRVLNHRWPTQRQWQRPIGFSGYWLCGLCFSVYSTGSLRFRYLLWGILEAPLV